MSDLLKLSIPLMLWRVMLPNGVPYTSAVFFTESIALDWAKRNAKKGCWAQRVDLSPL